MFMYLETWSFPVGGAKEVVETLGNYKVLLDKADHWRPALKNVIQTHIPTRPGQ